MGRDEAGKVKLSVGEAKARLLEFGHRPRGPKAAIRRDPVTATIVAFFAGILISRFRPGALLPLGAILSRPVLQRALPIIAKFAAAKFSGRLGAQPKARRPRHAAAPGAQHRPYQAEPFSAPRAPAPGPSPFRARSGEWAMGPQQEGFSPPRARS